MSVYETDRDRVLAMLREAGDEGVHTETLARNGGGRNVSERRRELVKLGYRIDSVSESWVGRGGSRRNGARYFLRSEPDAEGGSEADEVSPGPSVAVSSAASPSAAPGDGASRGLADEVPVAPSGDALFDANELAILERKPSYRDWDEAA